MRRRVGRGGNREREEHAKWAAREEATAVWEGRNRERKKGSNKRKEKGFMKEKHDGIRGEKVMTNREGKVLGWISPLHSWLSYGYGESHSLFVCLCLPLFS